MSKSHIVKIAYLGLSVTSCYTQCMPDALAELSLADLQSFGLAPEDFSQSVNVISVNGSVGYENYLQMLNYAQEKYGEPAIMYSGGHADMLDELIHPDERFYQKKGEKIDDQAYVLVPPRILLQRAHTEKQKQRIIKATQLQLKSLHPVSERKRLERGESIRALKGDQFSIDQFHQVRQVTESTLTMFAHAQVIGARTIANGLANKSLRSLANLTLSTVRSNFPSPSTTMH